MARKAFALALLAAMALSGCSQLDNLPFVGNKKAKVAEARAVMVKARADSVRKARKIADSIAVVLHVACVDSVRAELSKPVPVKKTRGKRKKPSALPSPELIATQAQTICEQGEAAPQTTIVANTHQGDSATAPAKDMAAKPAAKDTAAQKPAAIATRTDSSMQQATDQSAWADSVRKAKETEMSRESFAYSGGSRDPFVSLLNLAKTGPEVADLQLVGIYRNMRTPSGSVAVFRERDGGKRHRLRAGDQLGRSRLVEIRERDVVFMIEDFGFERQETLSLRKQEDVTP